MGAPSCGGLWEISPTGNTYLKEGGRVNSELASLYSRAMYFKFSYTGEVANKNYVSLTVCLVALKLVERAAVFLPEVSNGSC